MSVREGATVDFAKQRTARLGDDGGGGGSWQRGVWRGGRERGGRGRWQWQAERSGRAAPARLVVTTGPAFQS